LPISSSAVNGKPGPFAANAFRPGCGRHYYQETGEALSAKAVRSAIDLLEARAQFDAPERTIHVRVAEQAGHIYLDLADERAAEIGSGGWRVIGSPPVRFSRPAGMLPLPAPERGGSIEALDPLRGITLTTVPLLGINYGRLLPSTLFR
jgi:hypothetical protein